MSDGKKKKFIQHAIKHPGALTKKANAAGETPMAYAHEHEDDSGTTGKQSRLAITLSHMSHAHKTKSASHKTIRKSMYHGD